MWESLWAVAGWLAVILAVISLLGWSVTFGSTLATFYLVFKHWRLRKAGVEAERLLLARGLPDRADLPDVVVQPNDYIIIWADEDPSTPSYIHANFKLSASGEWIGLSTADSTVLDSITYGIQDPDISMGRCPNGTGPFTYFIPSTFDALNACPAGVEEITNTVYMTNAYPNPASDRATVFSNHPSAVSVQLLNMNGDLLQAKRIENDQAEISLEGLPTGLYFYRTVDEAGLQLQSGRLVVIH